MFGLPYIISISLNLHIQLELGNDLVICLTIGSSTHIFRYKHYTNKYSKTWTFSWRPVAFSKICIVFFLLAVLIQDLLCLIQNWLFLKSLFRSMFVFPCLWHHTCLFLLFPQKSEWEGGLFLKIWEEHSRQIL